MPVVPLTPADRVYARREPIAHGAEIAGYPLYGLVEEASLAQLTSQQVAALKAEDVAAAMAG